MLFTHDVIAVVFSIFLSYVYFTFITHASHRDELFFCEAGIGVSTIIILLFHDNFYKYQFVLNRAKHTVGIIKFLIASLTLLIVFSFFFKIIAISTSRIYVGTIYFTLFMVFLFSRVFLIPVIYYWLVKNKKVSRNLIIIGTGELSISKVKFLNESKKSYYHIIGFLDNDAKEGEIIEGYPVLGKTKDMIKIIREYKIKDILISLENMSNYKLQGVIDFCKRSGRTIHVVSELYDIVTEKMEIDEIGGISSFRLKRTSHAFYESVKRWYDIFIALFFILAFSPFWLLLALLIKITSKGPIFYRPKVVGFGEKEFTMYKFRSMYYQSSVIQHEKLVTEIILNNKPTEKLKTDKRITLIGKILRKLSLDEFPQLINVLKGEMSIVGPRPCLPYEYEVMDEWHRRRFAITPGITGLWQIKGRNEVKFNDQIALDLYYIEHRSLRLDFEILFKTIPVVIFGKGGL